jgi:hypothetical protein
MSLEDPGSVSFAGIGGLGDQVRELREVIELPLMNPELFEVSQVTLGERGLTDSEWVLNLQKVFYSMVHLVLVSCPILSKSRDELMSR